jgi:hypothetical protein
MRHRFSIFLVAVLVLGAAAPASAADPESATFARFNGRSAFEFSTHGCGFVYQTFTASYRDPSGGRGQFRMAGCSDFGGAGFVYSGRLLLDPPSGVSVGGTVAGGIEDQTPPFPCRDQSATPVSLELTLTPDTGPVMHLFGTWCSDAASGGPILGVLSN